MSFSFQIMEISVVRRVQIVALVESGMKMKNVAFTMSVSPQVVSLTMKRYRDTGAFASKPRSGRPPVTTEKDDCMMKRAVVVNPNLSSVVMTCCAYMSRPLLVFV